MKEEKTLAENFGNLCGALLIMALSVAMRGLSLMKYWEWFICPVFGLPLLLFKHSVGLAFFLAVAKASIKEKEDERSFLEIFGKYVVVWAMFFLFGYIIHLFIA